MEGIFKSIVLLICLGMLVFFLGSQAFSVNAEIQPREKETGSSDLINTEVQDELTNNVSIQEEISSSWDQIIKEKEALSVEWNNLNQERENLNEAYQILSDNQIAMENERVEIDQKWSEINARQASIEGDARVLIQFAEALSKRDQALLLKEQQMARDEKVIQDEYRKLRQSNRLQLFVAVGLGLLTVGNGIIFYINYKARHSFFRRNLKKQPNQKSRSILETGSKSTFIPPKNSYN